MTTDDLMKPKRLKSLPTNEQPAFDFSSPSKIGHKDAIAAGNDDDDNDVEAHNIFEISPSLFLMGYEHKGKG